ncbi:hypothetical protein [Paludibacterium yongneupense]|nr:hypothetical protein [Paludibacterium yongneupense]
MKPFGNGGSVLARAERPPWEHRLNAAREAIVAGRLRVVDYRRDNRCPLP